MYFYSADGTGAVEARGRLAEQLASRSSVFRKLALRRSAEQHPGRVGSNVFGDNFRCLITSVHVDAMLGEPASMLTRSPTPMHLSSCVR